MIFESHWAIWTNCKRERGSLGRLDALGELLGQALVADEVARYEKTGGHKVRFVVRLESRSWNDAVVECIAIGQRAASGWSLSGQVEHCPEGTVNGGSVSGILMMSWRLVCSAPENELGTSGAVRIGANETTVDVDGFGGFALELSMLLQGVREEIQIGKGRDLVSLVLSDIPKRGRVTVGKREVRAELAVNQVEYLLATLLRAHRDGLAEVDHMHVELDADSGEYDLTFLFARHRAPLSPSEAAELLKED